MAAQVQDAQPGVARRHVGLLAQPLSREAGREVVPRCIETTCRLASGAVGRHLTRMWIQGNTRNQGNSDQMFKPDTTTEEFIPLSSHVAAMVVKNTGGNYLMVWSLGGLPFVGRVAWEKEQIGRA